MKLYHVPRQSFVRVLVQQPRDAEDGEQLTIYDEIDKNYVEKTGGPPVNVPPGAPSVDRGEILYFINIDGMYSYCQKYDKEQRKLGEVCHIAAWTDVEVIGLDELFPFEEIRKMIGRSGYGKDGKGEYRTSPLCEMNDEWVKNSIPFVGEDHEHCKFYKKELEYRKENGISIPDEE